MSAKPKEHNRLFACDKLKPALCNSNQFFTNHFGNNLGEGQVQRFSLGTEIFIQYPVKGGKQIALAGEKDTCPMLERRRGFSPKFVYRT